jgi:hypothetical protein
MKLRRPRQAAVLGALTAALAALAAAPAVAAPAPIAATGEYVRTAPFIDGTIYEIRCSAVAPAAVTTRIDSCRLTGPGGTGYSAPATSSSGSFATTDLLASIPTYDWQLCWTASATYADGTGASTTGCTTVSPYAGAGASSG